MRRSRASSAPPGHLNSFGNMSARAVCPCPRRGCVPRLGQLSFALLQTPKLSPSPGLHCLLGGCQWGVSLPLHCWLEISPSPSWLGALSLCLLLCPQCAHGPLSHLGKRWMGHAFGLLAAHLPDDFFSIFLILFCLRKLKSPASSCVCQLWLLKSCTGAGWRGKPGCCPAQGEAGCWLICPCRQGEPGGVVTASLLSCSNDLIPAGTSALQWGSLRQGLGQAAGERKRKLREIPLKTLTHCFFCCCF